MDISLDRLKHIKAVAVKMRRIVLENLDKFPYTPDEMFALGYVHDIGYAFCDDAREHAHKGGELLRTQHYKYWREVYYHGVCQDKY